MPDTFIIEFDGTVLRRGFWLYVWDIAHPNGDNVLYVGRTGDNSSPYAQALLWRIDKNAGETATTRMVRRHLEKKLAEDLRDAGYDVMNTVNWKPPLDPELYAQVRAAFAVEFPALAAALGA